MLFYCVDVDGELITMYHSTIFFNNKISIDWRNIILCPPVPPTEFVVVDDLSVRIKGMVPFIHRTKVLVMMNDDKVLWYLKKICDGYFFSELFCTSFRVTSRRSIIFCPAVLISFCGFSQNLVASHFPAVLLPPSR